MKPFFVYVHMRPDGTPFYVGKGLFSRTQTFGARNPHYMNVVKKYGTDNLIVEIFPQPSEAAALAAEIALIAKLRAEGCALTNITRGGEGVVGVKQSAETIAKRKATQKITLANKPYVPMPQATRDKLRIASMGNKNSLGIPVPQERRDRISQALKGNKCALGHVLSAEAKEKIRLKKLGTKCALGHVPSEEVRAEWSRKRKGVPWSAARRAACEKQSTKPAVI